MERIFAWLGRCRRLAKDWEKSIESATAFALIATFNRGRLSLDGDVMLLDLQPAGWVRRCADECPYPELVEG